MATKYPEFFAALAAPFDNVKTLVVGGGRTLRYINARDVMNRLDSVVGPEGWTDEYTPVEKGVLCELTITLPGGERPTKSDVGGYAGMEERKGGELVHDEENDVKSAYSDALKRAAVKFLVGRYLYGDGLPEFCPNHPASARPTQQAPPRPQPSGPQQSAPAPRGPSAPSGRDYGRTPTEGKHLWAFCKRMQADHGADLIGALANWGKGQKPAFPYKMYDWAPDQIALGFAEGTRILDAILDEKEGVRRPAQGTNGTREAPLADALRAFDSELRELAKRRGEQPTPGVLQGIREEIDPEGQVVDMERTTDLALIAAHTESVRAMIDAEVPY